MITFKDYITEQKKIKWLKKPDGYIGNNKKVFKHVSSDGKFEIRLSGMDSSRKNKDGSQKIMPTLFDMSGHTPRHPVIAYKNVAAAKKNAQIWADSHWNITEGEGKYKGETWEDGYKRRVVKTTDPEHKDDGYNWRIKGKERDEISIKLYKNKPDFAEFKRQMKRVAGHEFGG